MQDTLRLNIENEKKISAENFKISKALDTANSSTTICDGVANIIYINRSAGKLLKKHEAVISQQLGHFSADEVLGSTLDKIGMAPTMQTQLLSHSAGDSRVEFHIGELFFKKNSRPCSR